MCGAGGYCDSDSVLTSCGDGPWKVRADEAVLPNRSGQPCLPIERERGQEEQLFIYEKVLPSASGQSSACLAGEHGQWEPQAELQGKPPPTAAYAGALSLLFSCRGRFVPHPLSQQSHPGAKELKKARLKSTAGRELSPELPRGQSHPSPGEPHSEHPHSLQILSFAPLPNTRLIGTTCPPQANETPGLNSVTQSKSWLCWACH